MTVSTEMFHDIVHPDQGNLSPEFARYLISLSFSAPAQRRYLKLSEKAQLGKLTTREEAELDRYLSTNAFLMVLQSKARKSLARRSRAEQQR
ncbi:MAG TPA: hypothetical protein VK797_28625 [Tepidisphaeraceae bacterium]|jgi:hypothetical protein|nr:hypothetical protein [Tepidisphaeraceae bacterium]